MTRTHFAEGQILFREKDTADSVLRLVSGTVDVVHHFPAPGPLATEGGGVDGR